MMSITRLALVAGLAVAVSASGVRAHPPAILNQAAEQAIGDEVKDFRKAMAEAIKAKDAVKLKEMYHPGFTHTHTSGKTDNRDARIVSAITGEPVIETAEVTELTFRAPNDWVVIAQGTSPIKSMADGKTYAVKWIQVFTRAEKSWQLVASQATRSHEIK